MSRAIDNFLEESDIEEDNDPTFNLCYNPLESEADDSDDDIDLLGSETGDYDDRSEDFPDNIDADGQVPYSEDVPEFELPEVYIYISILCLIHFMT